MDLTFDIPRLRNFIDRTEGLKPFKQADIWLSGRTIEIFLGSPIRLELKIRCERPDWQLSSMTQIFSQQLPLISLVERLEICDYPSSWGEVEWKDDPDMDSSQWLELLHLFVAAQSLHISGRLVHPAARALQDLIPVGQMATKVLLMLRTVFLEGPELSRPVHEAIKSFAAARQPSRQPAIVFEAMTKGHPIYQSAPSNRLRPTRHVNLSSSPQSRLLTRFTSQRAS
jgi:hypothetical protein